MVVLSNLLEDVGNEYTYLPILLTCESERERDVFARALVIGCGPERRKTGIMLYKKS